MTTEEFFTYLRRSSATSGMGAALREIFEQRNGPGRAAKDAATSHAA